jgi:hypothetical protein
MTNYKAFSLLFQKKILNPKKPQSIFCLKRSKLIWNYRNFLYNLTELNEKETSNIIVSIKEDIMKKLILSFALFGMFSSIAMAGIHLEPYLGYAKGSEGNHTPSTGDQNAADYTGIGFGARVGISYLGLLAGLTYDSQGINATDDDSPAIDIDYKGTNMGAFVGYEFPLGLRLWFSYYVDSAFEIDAVNGGTSSQIGDSFNGNGMSIGVGMSVIPMVLAVNLEYKSFTYDEYEDVSTGRTLALTGNSEASSSYLFLSVSAPLGF